MTCRDFMDAAEFLTAPQLLLTPTEDPALSAHARECRVCGKWMESRRLLSSGLQALRSGTAQGEAGPQVEQAVLQAFRTEGFAPAAVILPEPAAPALWKLSRFFEFGAYAAVAAALIVGVFLGSRIVRNRQTVPAPSQAQTATAPPVQSPVAPVVADNGGSAKIASVGTVEKLANSNAGGKTGIVDRRSAPSQVHSAVKTADNAGYVALMLCDPLICSGDEQVIRMELPATGAGTADGATAQPVIADVVIGEDGLVRAMRIVN